MGLMKEHPRYNVISLRISDEEREDLQQVTKMTNKSISEVMREAILLVKARFENVAIEGTNGPFS